jgi:HEAT repeat protein
LIVAGRLCVAVGAEPSAVPEILIELIRSTDRDTRGLALREVREGVPGEAATKQLAALARTLDPEGQAALLEALADRRDPSARPALVQGAKSQDERVRIAALRALGRLGTAAEIELLARHAVSGSTAEKESARRSLVQLRGDDINSTMVKLAEEGEREWKVELLQILSARKAVAEASSVLLKFTKDRDAAVRVAAFRAAEVLATGGQADTLVQSLCAAATDSERLAAEAAVRSLSRRARQACLDAILKAWVNSEPNARVSLLRCLAAIPGPEALEKVVESVKGGPGPVQDEAVAILAAWEAQTAAAPLLELARKTKSASHHAAAIRGLVRLASADEHRANADLLVETWALAQPLDERRLVLGALGGASELKALQVAVDAFEQADVRQEAALAAVLIGERLARSHPEECAAALRNVAERIDDPDLQKRIRALGLKLR